MKLSQRRCLPKRSISLTPLGLGGAPMGCLYETVSMRDALETIEAAWESGIRFFDTAPYYGYTRAERRLGAVLDGFARDEYVVSTKAGRLLVPDATVGADENGWVRPLPFRPTYDYSYDGIMRSFEASQQRLGVVTIDILFVHDIGVVTHGDRHHHYWTQLTRGNGFRALEELRNSGRVGAVGLGVNEWDVVMDAMQAFDLDVTMLAGRYTLLEQTSLPCLETCLRHGNAVVAAGVFNSGVLVGNNKFNYADAPPEILERVSRLQAACAEFSVPLAAAALQFPLRHPAVLSCAVGARSAAQLHSNVALFDTAVPDGLWSELKQLGLIDEAAPTSFGP